MPATVDPETLIDLGVCPRCHHELSVTYGGWQCWQCGLTERQAEAMV